MPWTDNMRSSRPTEELILQTLLVLVSQREGAVAFTELEDPSPLTEIAPAHPLVLEVFSSVWLQSMTAASEDRHNLSSRIDKTIGRLVSSFKGTDAVTLLAFLGDVLRKLDPEVRLPC